MKYEITSNHTKKMLAESLKKFLISKPFSKVTVSEIIRDCGVNRKTFYYHFEDINALLIWCLQEDFTNLAQQFVSINDLRGNLMLALNYVDTNTYILNCIHDSLGLIEVKKFLYELYIPIILNHFFGMKNSPNAIPDTRYTEYIYPFWAYGLVNLLLDQYNDLTPYRRREDLVNYIVTTCEYILQSVFPDMPQEEAEIDS